MWRLIMLFIVVSISAATALEPAAAGEKRSAHPNKPKKQQANKKEGRTLDYDYGSVYCHQGCAGGFTGVLSGTARNPGMKR
jgi:hypothetical protein